MKEMVGGCCVCSDERGWPDNPLVYCDGNGCTVAVHQACYGIVTVPTGPWYCRKCESPDTKGKVRCELCPSKSGALKRSDTGGWAHVVCALYIPEVRFGNVTSMEPIVLRLIPAERYNKTCYICQDLGKPNRATAGACMQCNKSGCKQQFHVTCAQSLGLLCEEAGNYLDNVKYCGYCQHHYSKLKKGGNVKTIPPYKPVSHDSPSSDSSGEKEGNVSPKATDSGTPTHNSRSKGGGRKSSHSNNVVAGKSTPNSNKPTPNTTQPSDKSHKSSPARRGSAADAAGSGGSKGSTPAPSPQHATDASAQINKEYAVGGGSTPGGSKMAPQAASPGPKGPTAEPGGVISTAPASAATAPASMAVTTSVVQAPISAKPTSYQESVITNTESMDTKQTKKRKAVNAANSANNQQQDHAPTPPLSVNNDIAAPGNMWDNSNHYSPDVPMENIEKLVKKAKTEGENTIVNSHYNMGQAPPPAHSPSSQPSPRQIAGPSGMNQSSNIRSPSQQGKAEREGQASLLVSVPLPSTSQGLNLSAHAHAQVSAVCNENAVPSPHIFHQMQKQAAMEQSIPSHSPLPTPGRSTWGGLNVSYEMQDPGKSSMSNVAYGGKDVGGTTIRNKKRAAMSASVVSMATTTSPIQTTTTQILANVRRPAQPTPPPLIYQETIKDSPPSSPGSEKPLKPKMESKPGRGSAPHMLGNELNPESGAAARLQEQLSAELAAHAAGGAAPTPLVPPPLINKAQGAGTGSRSGTGAQSLDQLLERQWEQGSQFLMEQAQHFDIASLLSCLHQLRTENVRLEEHVGSLLQRRDHLLAVNARLAIPLTAHQAMSSSGGGMGGISGGIGEPGRAPPAMSSGIGGGMGGSIGGGVGDPGRVARENGAAMRAPPGPTRESTERHHQMMVREGQQKPS